MTETLVHDASPAGLASPPANDGPRVAWRLDDGLESWARWLAQSLHGSASAAFADDADRGTQPLLVLLPSAAAALGRAATDGGDLEARRTAWLNETRRLLRAHQAAPGRMVLLLADELHAQPRLALDALRAALQLPPGPQPAADPPAGGQHDGPATLLAEHWIRADHVLALAWDELLASCLPLAPDDTTAAEPVRSAVDHARALQAHGAAVRDRRAAEWRIATLEAERDAAARSADDARRHALALEQQCQDLTQDLTGTQARFDAAAADWVDERRALADELQALEHASQVSAAEARSLSAQAEAALDEARTASRTLADENAALAARVQWLEQQASEQAAASDARDERRQRALQDLEHAHQQLRDEHQLRHLQWAQAVEELQASGATLAALQQQLAAQTAAAEDAARIWTQRLDELTRERDAEAGWHQENARWAQGLDQELSALKPLLQQAQQRAADLADREQATARELAAAQAADAERQASLQALEQAGDVLRADRQLLQLQLAQAMEELQTLQQQHARQLADAPQAREARAAQVAQVALTSERDLLAAQLQAAIAELEALHGSAPEAATALRQLTTEPLELVHVRDEAPHRELSLEFRDIHTPSGVLPRLLVRLVEHAGHPGLVLFRPAGGPPPLTQWRASGTEGADEFMILLPADQSPGNPLAGMASPNWRFVQALADTVVQEILQDDGTHLHAHWPAIAVRLQQQLAVLPPRLRYAGLQVQPAQGELEVCFDDVVFGQRHWPALRLRWRLPDTGLAPALTCTRAADDTLPLLVSWPTGDDGTFAPDCPLQIGRAFPASARQDWWARLPADDRALVSALLDALPAVGAAPGAVPGVEQAAAALRSEVARTVNGMRLRHQARRLLRRVTRSG